jgi:hypothetical protein
MTTVTKKLIFLDKNATNFRGLEREKESYIMVTNLHH